MDIDGGREHDVHALGAGLFAHRGPNVLHQRLIPRRGYSNGRGKGSSLPVVADAERAVRHLDFWDAQPLILANVKAVLTADHVNLLLERHAREEVFNSRLYRRRAVLVGRILL